MHGYVSTAGELLELDCGLPWLSGVLAEGAAGQLRPVACGPPTVRVTVERQSAPFDTDGWRPLTRGASSGPGRVVVRDACSSGLDILVTVPGDQASGVPALVRARYRPPPAGRLAACALRSRARLLLRAVLLQYPALWWAGTRGRVPLHASVCTLAGDPAAGTPGRTVLLAGPGGVGKSTLVSAEIAAGADATCDNVCASDGRAAWGLLEPRRIPARAGTKATAATAETAGTAVPAGERERPRGRRMPHGRRETPWARRAAVLEPDLVVVPRRGHGERPTVRPIATDEAERALVAGTYMAGELRRYWAFAATIALGTGAGPAHPPVAAVAGALAAALPCQELLLPAKPGSRLAELFSPCAPSEVV